MDAVWAVVRSEGWARRRPLLGLTLLVALASGVVLTTAAGARRTETSFERFEEAALARDAKVQLDEYDLIDEVFPAIESLPEVIASGRAHQYPVYVAPEVVDSVEFDLAIAAPEGDGWANTVDRGLLLSGRRPNPKSPSEVLLNESAADQSGLEPGDSLAVATFTPDDLDTVISGEGFPGFNGPTIDLEVVGVARQADELLNSLAQAGPAAIATPAFYKTYGREIGGFSGLLAIRLSDPVRGFERLQQVLREVAGPDAEVEAVTADEEFSAGAESGIGVLANALWVVTLVAALAGAVAVGGALRRQVEAHLGLAPVLSSLGFTRALRAIAVGTPIAGAIVVGVTSGALASILASTLLPIGLARRAEPSPGIDVDLAVLLLGGIAIAFAAVGWLAVITGRSSLRVRPAEPARATPRTDLALRLGTAAGLGVREGLSRRRGTAGTGAVGVALGAAGVVAVATVVASLHALVDDPSRYGYDWSSEPDALDGIDDAVDSLRDDERIDAVGVLKAVRIELGGRQLQGVSLEVVRGDLEMTILEGRAPMTGEEIALGERTASRVGVAIGDALDVPASDGASTRPFRVVGTAVFRPVDNPDAGDGALLTEEGLDSIARSGGFESLLLRYPDAGAKELEDELVADHPLEFSAYSYPRVPPNVANLDRTDGLLQWLGGFFVVVGALALGHAVVVSVGRRRRELSTLRALGFLRRQVRAAVQWQAIALVVVGVAVGAPVGVAAGRGVWLVTVGDYGLVDDPTTPVLALVVTLPIAVAVAWVLSWWPGRRAATIPLEQAMRSE